MVPDRIPSSLRPKIQQRVNVFSVSVLEGTITSAMVFLMGYFFYFHFIFLYPFCFSLILMVCYMIVIIKMKINVLWEISVTASLSRAPQSFRTMDRWSRTEKFLRKGLLIAFDSRIWPVVTSRRKVVTETGRWTDGRTDRRISYDTQTFKSAFRGQSTLMISNKQIN